MFITLLIIVCTLLAVHCLTEYSRTRRLVNKIPGVKPLPFIGNLLDINLQPDKLWDYIRQITKDIYPITRLWRLTYALILVRDPDDIKIVLSCKTNLDKGMIYKYLEPWSKTGLVNSKAQKWKQRRKLITPAFHINALKEYLEIMNEHEETFIHHIKSLGNETIQNVKPLVSKFILNIICESSTGVSLDNFEVGAEIKYRNAIADFFEIVMYKAMRPYLKDWMLKFSGVHRKEKNAIKELRYFVDKIVKDRREYYKSHSNLPFENYMDNIHKMKIEDGSRKKLTLLDVLLAAESEGLIDDEGIKEEIDTFISAGFNTTVMGTVHVLLALAENKEAQNLARAEAMEVLNDANAAITMAHIKKLNYIERCIKETLRLFPSVPHITRNVIKEIQLKNYTIPVGSEIVLSLYDVHRDSNFWPEPDKFDPDRFLPENFQKCNSFAYVPFSAGIRNCIGQKFAMSEMISTVARILCNFQLEPVTKIANVKFNLNIVLFPSHPIYVKFIKLDKQ